VDGQLAGAGAGDQIACAEQVEEFLAREPAAAAHEFVFHDGDVRGGSTEGGDAEPQKEGGEFAERTIAQRAGTR
jgi:hypothetical protein